MKISDHCKDPQTFWDLVKTHFLHAIRNDKTKEITGYWMTTMFWDFHKEMDYWQTWEMRIGKIGVQLAGDFEYLLKKENLHKQVFTDINKWWKLFKIKRTHKDKGQDFSEDAGWTNDTGRNISGKFISGQNKPAQATNLPGGKHGALEKANFLATELDIKSGLRTKDPDTGAYKTAPDFSATKGSNKSAEKSHFHKDSTVFDEQQPAQKLSQILRCFKLVEFNISRLWANYEWHFQGFSYPQGKLIQDPRTGFFSWLDRVAIEEKVLTPTEKKKKKEEEQGVEYLTPEQWKAKYIADAENDAVEATLELENLSRYKNYSESQAKKTSGGTKEGYERIAVYCEGALEAYERPVIWTDLAAFDKVMGNPPEFNDGKIIGFIEFKRELRDLVETIEYYTAIGKMPPQVYYCLLGKPGVGKTQICLYWAEAWQRSYKMISYNGAQYLKIIDGSPPTYKGADIGGILDAIVNCRADVTVTRQDLVDELEAIKWNKYTKKPKVNLTERQKGRIEKLTKKIAQMDEDGVSTIKEARLSSAPIILIDEYEKAKTDELKEKVGVLFDPNSNREWLDNFFGHAVNLNSVFFVSTANWRYKNGAPTFPDFVDSRLTFVNIELLTYQQRVEIARDVFVKKVFIYQYFPAFDDEDGIDPIGENIDKINKSKNPNTWTVRQEKIVNLFDDDFIDLLIDEQWGVRGIIQNLTSVVKFLVKLIVRGKRSKGIPKTNFGSLGYIDDMVASGQKLSQAIKKYSRWDSKGDGLATLTYRFKDDATGRDDDIDLTIQYKRNIDLARNEEGNKVEAEDWTTEKPKWVRETPVTLTQIYDDMLDNVIGDIWRPNGIPSWWQVVDTPTEHCVRPYIPFNKIKPKNRI